jgi:hypothetical protein
MSISPYDCSQGICQYTCQTDGALLLTAPGILGYSSASHLKLASCTCWRPCRGFPVEQFRHDKVGLVLAFWAMLAHLGRPLVSQTDYDHEREGEFYGSILNHITVGRHSKGAL